MNEAADMLTIPRKLQKNWCTMPFYGTPKHNAKAVYQKYLGWYDANPLHLEELPPELLAQEQMRYMLSANDITSMLSLIEEDIQRGNYWIAAYMAQQIILGNNDANVVANAKVLCADALEQLGYQAQSGTWRNAYLCASYELRNGKKRTGASGSNATVQHMTFEMLLDYIAILFDGERASSKINFDGVVHIYDDKTFEDFALIIRNGAIMYYPLADLINLSEFKISPQLGGEQLSVSKDTLLEILGMTQDVTKTDWDIYNLLKEKYEGETLNYLIQIASCMVNLKLDRYKYFDIMDKHDSEVCIDGKLYNLKSEAVDCIDFLNGYKNQVLSMKTNTLKFEDEELAEWKKYYSILKEDSDVILEGDFITANNDGTLGIGNDGLFQQYEYWYTMYSLYRYLSRGYVNNDCYLQNPEVSVEDFIKLKKKIQLLESYVPDLYLEGNEKFGTTKYRFDDADGNAWSYLEGSSSDFNVNEFHAQEIFKKLYECYKQLGEMLVNPTMNSLYMSLNKHESNSAVELSWDFMEEGNYQINGVGVSFRGSGFFNVDLDSDIATFVAKKDNKVIDVLVFHKPQMTLSKGEKRDYVASVLAIAASDNEKFINTEYLEGDADIMAIMPYAAPPEVAKVTVVISYTSKYASKLVIGGKEITDGVSSGSVELKIETGETVKARGYSECGFYIEAEVK